MAKMGKGRACGPDELPIEAVHIILDYKPECIVEAFNITSSGQTRCEMIGEKAGWYLFKGKGDVLERNNYSGIKLMSHTMKLWGIMI